MKLPKIFHKLHLPHHHHHHHHEDRSSANSSGSGSHSHNVRSDHLSDDESSSGSTHSVSSMASLFEDDGEQKLHLVEAFRIIDKDGDGHITRDELKAMWRAMGQRVTDRELKLMIQEVDVDGDGAIDLKEFMTLNSTFGLGFDEIQKHGEDIEFTFRVADADRDGYIGVSDLRKVMKELGVKDFSEADSQAMLELVDVDHDGRLDFEEFVNLMSSSALYHVPAH